MVNIDVVQARLKLLETYIGELKTLQTTDLIEYERNFLIHRAVERSLHLAVEACLDIGQHIIADDGLRAPVDNKDVFVVLHEEGVLPDELLDNLLNMASFRNLIVHDYATIDNAIVHRILQERLGDFEQFAGCVLTYIDQ